MQKKIARRVEKDERKGKSIVSFMDFSNAYNRVDRRKLYEIMWEK